MLSTRRTFLTSHKVRVLPVNVASLIKTAVHHHVYMSVVVAYPNKPKAFVTGPLTSAFKAALTHKTGIKAQAKGAAAPSEPEVLGSSDGGCMSVLSLFSASTGPVSMPPDGSATGPISSWTNPPSDLLSGASCELAEHLGQPRTFRSRRLDWNLVHFKAQLAFSAGALSRKWDKDASECNGVDLEGYSRGVCGAAGESALRRSRAARLPLATEAQAFH
jgi:hypothetical protein